MHNLKTRLHFPRKSPNHNLGPAWRKHHQVPGREVRGLTPYDEVLENKDGEVVLNPIYAAVGATECTTLRRGYIFPEYLQITIWICPVQTQQSSR